MRFSTASFLSLCLLNGIALGNPLKYGHAKTGAIASESSVCSNIGADVLKEGGNAADAVCIQWAII